MNSVWLQDKWFTNKNQSDFLTIIVNGQKPKLETQYHFKLSQKKDLCSIRSEFLVYEANPHHGAVTFIFLCDLGQDDLALASRYLK